MVPVTDRDRRYARFLPEKFKYMVGTPQGRVGVMVNRYWAMQSTQVPHRLARALLVKQQPLLEPGVELTDDVRAACEGIVASWLTSL